VIDAIFESEPGDDVACRVGVGDDAAGTVRVDVIVTTVVNSEAEVNDEPANDAGADGTGLSELSYSRQCAITQEHKIHNKLLCGQHSSLKHN
jgi:hypothetical protein